MRIDVEGFVQWGYVSDIPLVGMDCVKYHFPLQSDC